MLLAKTLKIDTPLCAAMDNILNKNVDIDKTIEELLARPVGDEYPLEQKL